MLKGLRGAPTEPWSSGRGHSSGKKSKGWAQVMPRTLKVGSWGGRGVIGNGGRKRAVCQLGTIQRME